MMEVTDDSGFLAMVVSAAYRSFVAENWEFKQLFDHFRQQMACGSLLIWATGLEGLWRVDVRVGVTDIGGFREVTGPLRVKGGSLLVTNYESLTMAAQFRDVRLPQRHEEDQLIRLPDGDYSCRIVQMFNPEEDEHAGENLADFVIAISKPADLPPVWSEVPWFKV